MEQQNWSQEARIKDLDQRDQERQALEEQLVALQAQLAAKTREVEALSLEAERASAAAARQSEEIAALRTELDLLKAQNCSSQAVAAAHDADMSRRQADLENERAQLQEMKDSVAHRTLYPSSRREVYEECLRKLESIVHECFSETWRVVPFGSAVTGFCSEDSDLDVAFYNDEEVVPPRNLMLHTLDHLMQGLKDRGFFVVELVDGRPPILKLFYKSTLSDKVLAVDVSNNPRPLQNTRLLSAYAALDERVRRLGILVKKAACIMGVIGMSRGNLSSYAWVLMVIYYLQCKHGMPKLNLEGPAGKDEVGEVRKKLGYGHMETSDQAAEKWTEWKSRLMTDTELLRGFYAFYAEEFKLGEHVVSIIDEARTDQIPRWRRRAKLRDGLHLDILDPIESGRNLALVLRKNPVEKRHQRLVDAVRYSAEELQTEGASGWMEFCVGFRGSRLATLCLDAVPDLFSFLPRKQRRLLCWREFLAVGKPEKVHCDASDWMGMPADAYVMETLVHAMPVIGEAAAREIWEFVTHPTYAWP